MNHKLFLAGFGTALSRRAHMIGHLGRNIVQITALFIALFLPLQAAAQSADHWDVEFWAGHFGVSIASNSGDHASNGPTGSRGGAPVLYGTGQTADSLSYTFDHQDINNRGTTDNHNPWKLLAATLASSQATSAGVYPNSGSIGDSGAYSLIFKRRAPFPGTLEIGKPGDYFDDFAEVYVNGVLTAWNSRFTGNLRGSIQVPVDTGDILEVRLTNGASLGGFRVNFNFFQPINADNEGTYMLDVSSSQTISSILGQDSVTILDPFTGSTTAGGIPAQAAVVTRTPIAGTDVLISPPNAGDYTNSAGQPVSGITLNPNTGSVTVAPGIADGTYGISYEICLISAPTSCDTAQETLEITGGAPATVPISNGYWAVEFYGGHAGVSIAAEVSDRQQRGPTGIYGAARELYGTGRTPSSLTYAFNHTNINYASSSDGHNPWKLLAGTLAQANVSPATGEYPNGGPVGNSGTYSMIYKRIAPTDGYLQVAVPGDYFDDFAEIYVNGTLTSWISRFTGSAQAGLFAKVSAGDNLELRLTNRHGLGGFRFTADFLPAIFAEPESSFSLGGSSGLTTSSILATDRFNKAVPFSGLTAVGGTTPPARLVKSPVVLGTDVVISNPDPSDYTNSSGQTVSGISLSPSTGEISVTSAVPPGTYTVAYEICLTTSTAACSTATETIDVQQINAAGQTFGRTPASCMSGKATFADLSGSVSAGTGVFTPDLGHASGPDFSYTLSGPYHSGSKIASSETWTSPAESSITSAFGFPGSEESLNIRMHGGPAGSPVLPSQLIRLVYNFDNPTKANEFGFAVTDVELEQVRFRARDKDGNAVGNAMIASWFVQTFDANSSNGGQNFPYWDAASAAIIGSSAGSPTWHTVRGGEISGDSEASGAWFQPTIELSQLTLEMTPYSHNGFPSIHSYLTHCQYPVPVAENDSVKGIDGDVGATDVMNVYASNGVATDKFGGLDVVNGDVNLTIEAVATPLPGATSTAVPMLDPTTGDVDVPAGTPAGTYTIDYKICGPVYTEYCDVATVTVIVSTINAESETFASIDSATGGSTGSILTSDTLNGATVDSADVNITVNSATGGLTLSTANEIVVAAGTSPGDYTLNYTICEKAHPAVCSTVTETVTVSPSGPPLSTTPPAQPGRCLDPIRMTGGSLFQAAVDSVANGVAGASHTPSAQLQNTQINNADVSHLFPGYPAGSILVSGSYFRRGGSSVAVGLGAVPQTARFTVTGTHAAYIRPVHGGVLVAGKSDGFRSLDGVEYSFTSSLAGEPTFTALRAFDEYSVALGGGSADNSAPAFTWDSHQTASQIEFFTTEADDDNNVWLWLAPTCTTSINTTKAATTVAPRNADGTFDVTYVITVQNLSNINLRNMNVVDDVASEFGAAFDSVIAAPTVTAVGTLSAETSNLMGNSGWAGDSANMLAASGQLGAGDAINVTFTVRIDPGTETEFENTATASGDRPDGTTVSDKSDDVTNGGDLPPKIWTILKEGLFS